MLSIKELTELQKQQVTAQNAAALRGMTIEEATVYIRAASSDKEVAEGVVSWAKGRAKSYRALCEK